MKVEGGRVSAVNLCRRAGAIYHNSRRFGSLRLRLPLLRLRD